MDCLVCNSRSAVESCVICHILLCEVCGSKCEKCGHVACSEHVHVTHSGKVLCRTCQEKRVAAHKAHHQDEQAAEDEMGQPFVAEEEIERPVLTASVRKPPPPWKMSLYVAIAGIVLALIMLALPSLRRFALPSGGFFPTPYLLMIIPAVAIFWGALGAYAKEYAEDRLRCLMGIGIAALACLLLLVAVYTDPARLAEAEAARIQSTREKMTPQQLEQWRNEKLNKFKR